MKDPASHVAVKVFWDIESLSLCEAEGWDNCIPFSIALFTQQGNESHRLIIRHLFSHYCPASVFLQSPWEMTRPWKEGMFLPVAAGVTVASSPAFCTVGRNQCRCDQGCSP